MPSRGPSVAVVLLAMALQGCGDIIDLDLCGPEGCLGPPRPCAELHPSALLWSLRGFGPSDILDPNLRDQRELTAILQVGQAKRLELRAPGINASEADCSGLARTVDWRNSNPVVARLTVEPGGRAASLAALQPGDVGIAADVGLHDGTSIQVLPWSFTNVGSGVVTVIRVVP